MSRPTEQGLPTEPSLREPNPAKRSRSGKRGLVLTLAVAVLVLCAGCRAMAGQDSEPPATVQTGQVQVQTGQVAPQNNDQGDPAGQLNDQLNQIQSTLDSVSAQVSADSTP